MYKRQHTHVLNDKVAILAEINEKSFAKGLIKLLENPNLAKKISKRAKLFAKEKYSETKYLEMTRKILETEI